MKKVFDKIFVSSELLPFGLLNREYEATKHLRNVAKDPMNNVVTHWSSGNMLTFDSDCPYCNMLEECK